MSRPLRIHEIRPPCLPLAAIQEPDPVVNHPKHYNAGKFEVIDVIEDWKLGFSLGNTVKYIARANHKGNTLQDLEKAAWYLNYEIQKHKQQASK